MSFNPLVLSFLHNNVSTDISPSFTMSRTSNGVDTPSKWVAPCSVICDGTLSAKVGETHINRNGHFAWDFGDGAKANEFWAAGSRINKLSKNRANGSVAGHVYDTPGTYYITLTITDADGKVNSVRQQITVADPDVVYAGAKTICFSNTADFTGAPVGSTQITTSSFSSAFEGQLILDTVDKRLLFKRGDTFIVDTITNSKARIKRIQIGAFGTGAKPRIEYDLANVDLSLIAISDTIDNPSDDLQFYDLHVVNATTQFNRAFFGGNAVKSGTNTIESTSGRVTIYRVDCENMLLCGLAGYGHAVVDCTATNPSGQTYASGGNISYSANVAMSMYAGNHFDNESSGEHVFRIQGHRKVYIESNTFINPSDTKHCFALRGSALVVGVVNWAINTIYAEATMAVPISDRLKLFRRVSVTGATPVQSAATEPDWSTAVSLGDRVNDGGYVWELLAVRAVETDHFYYISNYANIRNNHFGIPFPRNPVYVCTLMVQLACGSPTQQPEPIEDILFEGNYFAPNLITVDGTRNLLEIQAKRATVRNNIFNASGHTGGLQTFTTIRGLSSAQTPACDDVLVENNSFYSDIGYVTAASTADAGFTNIRFKNNIYYTPNGAANNNTKLIAIPNAEIVFENCSTTEQMKTVSPGYAVIPPAGPEDFALTAGSYALASGAPSGAFKDFYGKRRSPARATDIGAIDNRI